MSSEDIAREQRHLDVLYHRLDEMREYAGTELASVLRQGGGTHQQRSERDSLAALRHDDLTEYGGLENGLYFGRLDFTDGSITRIGRRGIYADSPDRDQLLMDWRAPAARPFYLATAASPEGVGRRRHVRTSGRSVTGVDDEVLDLDAVDTAAHESLTGETVLLAALNTGRTGRMSDIVETIQAEQDRIIRSDLGGVLVVQGGPGTGKTAVALHRAAYLLYNHRNELTRRGVLVVGPNPTFLSYIERVLPSLGETGVLLATVGELFPGVRGDRAEPAAAAAIKGSADMAEAMANAVADRQVVPEEPIEIVLDRESFWLDAYTVDLARRQARASLRPHNLARPIVAQVVVAELARQLADRIGADVLGGPNLLEEGDLAEMRRELAAEPAVVAVLDELWPVLTPQQLLDDLFAWDDRIASAAPWLSGEERALLVREPGGGWTPADVPLLDEAAELLGEDDRAARARERRERLRREAYAQGVLDIAAGSESYEFEDEAESEILNAFDVISAGAFAERHAEELRLTVAERAARDRTWLFGHIVVDEAQELSPMTWRLLMRRCPSRSMTLVGDTAQTGDAAGTTSWGDVLAPYVRDRWRLERLTVNYRTPAEIMAVAADVLTALDPDDAVPTSVRETGRPPRVRTVADPAAELPGVVADLAGRLRDGNLAVIVPPGLVEELGAVIAAAVPAAAVGGRADLESTVVVLDVKSAKGLEFDEVVLVEPAAIASASPRGLSDLYVALTRATQGLTVVHTGKLPASMAAMR